MNKRKLSPKCMDLKNELVARAERQIREAYPLLKAKGLSHCYSVHGDDGRQKEWSDCISGYAVVIRYDIASDRFVSHHSGERWRELEFENLGKLCECADFLLRKAYEPE